jgi:Concanavalin A-like lectin/glucanases superfamily
MLSGNIPALFGGALGNDNNTKLLMHFNNDLVDVARGAAPHVFTNFGCTFAGAFTPALLNNVIQTTADGQRITTPHSADFAFGAGDFTIDFWYYRNAATAGDIVGKRATNGEIAPFLLYDQAGVNSILCLMSFAGSAWDINITVPGFVLSTWQHVALVRAGTGISIYVGGVLKASGSVGATALWNNSNVLSIGGNTTNSTRAYIEEMRISNVARWLANFTPPNVAYS